MGELDRCIRRKVAEELLDVLASTKVKDHPAVVVEGIPWCSEMHVEGAKERA